MSDEEAPATALFVLRGFVSRPQVQKMNRNSIFLFVNRRLIKDRLLLHAISAAYHNLIPPSTYPFALLFVDCDPGEVDVNVHPSKTEVRFRHGTFVHDFVRDSIRQVLVEARPVSTLPLTVAAPHSRARGFPTPSSRRRSRTRDLTKSGCRIPERSRIPWSRRNCRSSRYGQPGHPIHDSISEGNPITVGGAPEPPAAMLRLRVPDTHGGFPPDLAEPPFTQAPLGQLRPLGQMQDSFIIAAGPRWLVDHRSARGARAGSV